MPFNLNNFYWQLPVALDSKINNEQYISFKSIIKGCYIALEFRNKI